MERNTVSSKDLRSKKIRAFVLLTMRPGTSEEIVKSRKIRGVTLANSVLGRFDAVAIIEADNSEQLTKISKLNTVVDYHNIYHRPD